MPNPSKLVIRNPDGELVSGVSISGSTSPLLRRMGMEPQKSLEVSKGVYSLGAFVPGAAVQIKPPSPYVPLCRIVPFSKDLEVSASSGRVVDLRLRRPGIGVDSPAWGSFEGITASDCPVTVATFDVAAQTTETGASTIRVRNFPRGDGLVWRLDVPTLSRHPVAASANGVIVLPESGGGK